MKTHYEYIGPNLTKVVYAGVSGDGKIAAKITTQLGRTDDMTRAWYHFEYDFLEDAHPDRLAFFQLGADRYHDNGFTRFAVGDGDGVLREAGAPAAGSEPVERVGYDGAKDQLDIVPDAGLGEGASPWAFMTGFERNWEENHYPEYASIGFAVHGLYGDVTPRCRAHPATSSRCLPLKVRSIRRVGRRVRREQHTR